MMQEHMNVEENQALGSTPFMLIVSFPYAPGPGCSKHG